LVVFANDTYIFCESNSLQNFPLVILQIKTMIFYEITFSWDLHVAVVTKV